MARIINIDEKLAAESEVKKEKIQMKFRKKTWNFSPSMPAQMPELFGEGKIVQAIVLALDSKQREDFIQLGVTLDEVSAIVNALVSAYGVTEGESEASE